MRITPERVAEIVRLVLAEKWPIGTVATQLGVHHSVVRRVVREVGVPLPAIAPRRSKLDPYMPFVLAQLRMPNGTGYRARKSMRSMAR